MTIGERVYLGDSVYMEMNEGRVVLTTRNGLPTDPSNIIYMEWFVLSNMADVCDKWKKEMDAAELLAVAELLNNKDAVIKLSTAIAAQGASDADVEPSVD